MRYLLATLLTAGALMVPAASTLQAAPRSDDHRYYDREHRDWHAWNDGENRAYRRYYDERYHGREYRDWPRVSERERANYWTWRHTHPDNVLWR